MTVISLSRPETTLCRRPRTPPKCFDDASKRPQAASNVPRDHKKTDKMLQEASKTWGKLPKTLPRHPKTPRNHAQDAFKTLQKVSKTAWNRLKIKHVKKLPHRTPIRNVVSSYNHDVAATTQKVRRIGVSP